MAYRGSARESQNPRLGRLVSDARAVAYAGNGRDVHDRAAARLGDLGYREAHREEMAAQVDVVHRLELLRGRVEQRAIDRDPDVVDEQMELAETAHCLLDSMTAIVLLAHIALD